MSRDTKRKALFVSTTLFVGLVLFIINIDSIEMRATPPPAHTVIKPALETAVVGWHPAATSVTPINSVKTVTRLSNDQLFSIQQQLESDNAKVRDNGLHLLSDLRLRSPRALAGASGKLLPTLIRLGNYDEAENLAVTAIVQKPTDIPTLEMAQRERVEISIRSGRFERAISLAKGYYNIASIEHSAGACKLVADILRDISGESTAVRFLTQQRAAIEEAGLPDGGLTPTSRPSSEPSSAGSSDAGNVLAAIDDDTVSFAKPLAKAKANINERNKNDVGVYLTYGNLLLLSGDALHALDTFQAALVVAGSNVHNLRFALEGVSRSVRGIDHNLARANHLINAIKCGGQSSDPIVLQLRGMKSAPAITQAAQALNPGSIEGTDTPLLETERVSIELKAVGGENRAGSQLEVDCRCIGPQPMAIERLTGSHYRLTMIPGALHDWFLFRVRKAKGAVVRFDIVSPDTALDHWPTLNPLVCQTDEPGNLENYAIEQDKSMPTLSWNGASLSSTEGQQWHYIPDCWMSNDHTFSMVVRLDSDASIISMRVPLLPSISEALLHKMAAPSTCRVIEIGITRGGHPLLVAEVGELDNSLAVRQPCVLVYAGEHADEHDAMWSVIGMAGYLSGSDPTARELRSKYTFLLIPNFDPDATSAGQHQLLMTKFVNENKNEDSIAYANWFEKWINEGHHLDMILDLHNVQSRESTHLACAMMEGGRERGPLATALKDELMKSVQENQFVPSSQAWNVGWMPNRLCGWLSRSFGALSITLELNSQAPARHLNLREIQQLGVAMLIGVDRYFSSPNGSKLIALTDQCRLDHTNRRGAAFHGSDAIADEAMGADMDDMRGTSPLDELLKERPKK